MIRDRPAASSARRVAAELPQVSLRISSTGQHPCPEAAAWPFCTATFWQPKKGECS
ncbi:hypothetical protein [Paracoccus mutanolyticus]|uniref:hypothetical protein n=1 Tax=Paracoccus mutanolyticus TaxID=1499308 RepID=UPI001671D7D1|nr:hypothetical protein [Paracoccus mutanolyticus]